VLRLLGSGVCNRTQLAPLEVDPPLAAGRARDPAKNVVDQLFQPWAHIGFRETRPHQAHTAVDIESHTAW
jgi:hypothetical protein